MSDKRIRVLFVDDEESNLKAFRSTFRREMDVLTASSGQEALELLERELVHVIISDQRMPGMTGSELLAIARKRFPRSMRMLLTGYADMEAVVASVNKGGIYAYATKPWDANDLQLRIQQAFEIQQLREDKDKLLNQYQQIFRSSGDPIVLVDHRGLILEANAACHKLMELPHEDLMRSNFTDFLERPDSLMKALKGRRNGTVFVNVDLTIRTRTGNLIDGLMTATYLGRQDSGHDVFQAIIKDVTDRKLEEKRLTKLNTDLDRRVEMRTAQLLEALEDLGSFSYTVAHDLRSPLKNIAALSDHLHGHAKEQNDVTACDFTERIHKGTQRMLELVDDLLNFSQTNTRELERREVELEPLVRAVIAEQVAEERLSQISIDIEPGATVLADAPMLKVALHNLLSNALKFSRTKEQPLIVIGHTRTDEHDLIRVTDNGVGFDPKHTEHVFAAFKRMHKADQFEGTGVGLAIVHRIVSKHGGQARAESDADRGTTIELALPKVLINEQLAPFMKVA